MIKEVNGEEILKFAENYFFDFKLLNDPFEKFYGYYNDSVLIGFISFSIIYERCEINYIAVDEKYRRKGIGSKLLKKVCLLNDFRNISLEVRSDNDTAINFYLKNGFKNIAVRKKYYGNVDGYLMVKEMR